MKVNQMLIGGFTATAAMTVYSLYVASTKKQTLTIPEVLSLLLREAFTRQYRAAGWSIHFAIGVAWSPIFYKVYNKLSLRPTLLRGLEAGLYGGLVGMGIWSMLLWLHPKTPQIHRAAFMLHLLIAHLVYGATVSLHSSRANSSGV